MIYTQASNLYVQVCPASAIMVRVPIVGGHNILIPVHAKEGSVTFEDVVVHMNAFYAEKMSHDLQAVLHLGDVTNGHHLGKLRLLGVMPQCDGTFAVSYMSSTSE